LVNCVKKLNTIPKHNFKIGLFGGSFNPPHEGHLLIANNALRLLKLDYIIWLVAYQNPFKSKYSNSFSSRLQLVQKLVKNHPQMIVSDIEAELKICHSYAIIMYLIAKFKYAQFIWISGADSVITLHKWEHARQITDKISFAVFDRPGYAYKALACPLAQKKAFTLYRTKLNGMSSTYLRKDIVLI